MPAPRLLALAWLLGAAAPACLAADARRPGGLADLRPEDAWQDFFAPAAAALRASHVPAAPGGARGDPASPGDAITSGEVLAADPDFAESLDAALLEPGGGEEIAPSEASKLPPAATRGPAPGAAPFADAAVRFMVVGDWGARNLQQQAVAAAMATWSRRAPPTAVISTGDNFYDFGVASARDEQWQGTFEQGFAAPELQVPWLAVLGNHDHYGSAAAQVQYHRDHPRGRWVLPDLNYTRTFPLGASRATLQLFFIDTVVLSVHHAFSESQSRGARYGPAGGDAAGADIPDRFRRNMPAIKRRAAAQLQWLEAQLAASTATWKVVVGHYPILSGGEHGGVAELLRDVRPLLVRYGVHAYVCGHDHGLQLLAADGVDYLVSGSGSRLGHVRPLPAMRFGRAVPGFAVLEAGPSRLVARLVDWNAEELAAVERRRARRSGKGGRGGGSGPRRGVQ